MIPASELHLYVKYDPETGIFTSVRSSGRHKIGGIIGSPDKDGYLIFGLRKKYYKSHRVAWAIMTGKWPSLEIDHKNSDQSDNRWENLREATRSQNNRNGKIKKNNRSGFKGVYLIDGKYWCAQIKHEGKVYYLGTFPTSVSAHDAYVAKSKELHGEFARAA